MEDHDHPIKKSPTDESHISTISQRQKRGALHAKSKRRALHWYFAKKTTIRCYVRPGDQKLVHTKQPLLMVRLPIFSGELDYKLTTTHTTRWFPSPPKPEGISLRSPSCCSDPQVGMPLLPAKHGIHVNDEISNNRIYIYIYRICIYIDICIYIMGINTRDT